MMRRFLSLALGSCFLAACGSSNGGGAVTNNQPTPTAGQSSALNYTNVNSQVLTPHCVYCHGAAGGYQGGVNLETYSTVLARIATVRSEVVSGSMPQDHVLPGNLQKLLIDWIDAGSPQ